MDEGKKKERDWSFLLPDGKPVSKQRLELKKIRDNMVELELDVEGFDFDTESNLRDFVMAKTTPGDAIVEFLKKVLDDASIQYTENGFRRLDKKGYLELFFALFTVGTGEGEEQPAAETTKPAAAAACACCAPSTPTCAPTPNSSWAT